jgi:hypothetical protein
MHYQIKWEEANGGPRHFGHTIHNSHLSEEGYEEDEDDEKKDEEDIIKNTPEQMVSKDSTDLPNHNFAMPLKPVHV